MGNNKKVKNDFRDKIEPFLSELTHRMTQERYKLIYEYYIEDMTMRGLAKKMNISRSAVSNRLKFASKRADSIVTSLCIKDGEIFEKPFTIDSKIEQLLLPSHIEKNLKLNDINKIGDLKRYTLKDIASTRAIGKKGFINFVKRIQNVGLDPYEIFKEMDKRIISYPYRIDIRELIEED